MHRHGLLLLLLLAAPTRADDEARRAVERALPRLRQGAASYVTHRQCFSCHHQAMAVLALAGARDRGFTVDTELLRQQLDFTLDTFRPKLDQVRKGQAIPGAATMAAYALLTLEVGGHAADEATRALVDYLLVRQKPDGSWTALTQRPPTEGSAFTNTALVLRALRFYRPSGEEERRQRIDAAYDKGRAWLLRAKPEHTEDRVFRLRGLATADLEADRVNAAREELLREQKPDGSWAQLANREGDAYATGTVLTALRAAGLATEHEAYRKGVQYLVKTQREDGAWLVETRSRPVQTFFDNGDPGGKSQFISFAATGWATLALLETFPREVKDGKSP